MKKRLHSGKAGFSLAELTIAVVVIALLATFAVPRYMQMVEKSKASEAFAYLAEIGSAQARYNAQHGEYASVLGDLDIELRAPNHFAVGSPTSGDWETEWEVALLRTGPASGYSPYSVIFDENGFNAASSTIPPELVSFN